MNDQHENGIDEKFDALEGYVNEMKRRHEAVYSFAELARNYHHHGEQTGMQDIHILNALNAIIEELSDAELFENASRLLHKLRKVCRAHEPEIVHLSIEPVEQPEPKFVEIEIKHLDKG